MTTRSYRAPAPAHAARVALAFLLAIRVTPAAAAPEDTQTAEALFQAGKEAMAKGDVSTACSRYADSVRLDPAAGSLLNLADCEQRQGKLASALVHFQAARDRLRADDYRVPYVAGRIAQLGPRAPRMTIVLRLGDAPGADVTVLRDDTPLGAGALGVALPVDAGPHVVTVRAKGRADARFDVALRDGEARTVDVAPGAALPPGADDRMVSTPSDAEASTPSAGRTQRAFGIAFGGAGLALVATGGVLGWLAHATYDDARAHCPTGPTSCTAEGVNGGSTAYSEARASTITVIAGSALVATGVVLYLTAPKTVHVAPSIGPSNAGLAIGGAW